MKYLSEVIPIVILYKRALTEKDWNSLCYFPKIYFIKGTALLKADLLRANINYCRKVVILSSMPENSNGKQSSDDFEDEILNDATPDMNKLERLIDAETIFQYKTIKKLKPQLEISVELSIRIISKPRKHDFHVGIS
jgi:hypothetical protein